MFFKLLKYDIAFSKFAFLFISVAMLAFATFIRFTAPEPTRMYDIHGQILYANTGGLEMLMFLFMVVVAVVSIVQVMLLFNSLFDDSGYLMLTLPASRTALLASKLMVSVIWFNIMVLIAAIAVIISRQTGFVFMGITRAISLQNFWALVEANLVAVFSILSLFFAKIFLHSSFGRLRFNTFVAMVVWLVVAGLYIGINVALTTRHSVWVYEEFSVPVRQYGAVGEYIGELLVSHTASFNRPIIGLRYGRIPVGEVGEYIGATGSYVDIFRIGATLLCCALVFFAMGYLFRKRVSL